jgi:hypothetical protein
VEEENLNLDRAIFDTQFIFGDFSRSPLDQLLPLMEDVYFPILVRALCQCPHAPWLNVPLHAYAKQCTNLYARGICTLSTPCIGQVQNAQCEQFVEKWTQ